MFLLIWLIIFIVIPIGGVILLYKTIKFVTAPICSPDETSEIEIEDEEEVEEGDNVLKVAIKSNNIDTSRIIAYEVMN